MPSKVLWRTDFEKHVVTKSFERHGFERWDSDDYGDWNIYWANVNSVKQIFNPDSGIRLGDHQLINHFPNHYELTRKDLMVKNIKRYRKEVEKEERGIAAELEFVPLTFVLPADYSLFVEEFRRSPNTTWIMKPTGKAQGKGIFLINKLAQIRRWATGSWTSSVTAKSTSEAYVVSRYIERPLLIGGKKFDLRLFVVVCSFRPLCVYMSRLGFARFCNVKYSNDLTDLDNQYVHLTNVAIQKHGEEYNELHGNKWPLDCLKLYLESTRGYESTLKLFTDIRNTIVHSLKACQSVINNDRHCFELYGYDLLVDHDLKPWLIEVNSSPSLSATTVSDRLMKAKVIKDTISVVLPEDFPESRKKRELGESRREIFGRGKHAPESVGSMDLLYDETVELEEQRAVNASERPGSRYSRRT